MEALTIAKRLRRHFLWGMPTGLEAFLGIPSVSGLRSCAQTHFKKALFHTSPVGGTADKYSWQYPIKKGKTLPQKGVGVGHKKTLMVGLQF